MEDDTNAANMADLSADDGGSDNEQTTSTASATVKLGKRKKSDPVNLMENAFKVQRS
jgi:hypothetical protein